MSEIKVGDMIRDLELMLQATPLRELGRKKQIPKYIRSQVVSVIRDLKDIDPNTHAKWYGNTRR